MQILIAVYGTLKRGHYNNANLLTSEFDGEDKVRGTIWLGPKENYPRAQHDITSDSLINVELYYVSARIMHQLARLEVPYGYIPQLVTTVSGKHAIMWASVEQLSPDCALIKDGNYV